MLTTFLSAFYGTVFTGNSEAAFANYRLWESVGFIIAFGYSSALCVEVKTYILLVLLLLGMLGYAITEVLWRREQLVEPPSVAPIKDEKTAM